MLILTIHLHYEDLQHEFSPLQKKCNRTRETSELQFVAINNLFVKVVEIIVCSRDFIYSVTNTCLCILDAKLTFVHITSIVKFFFVFSMVVYY